MSLFILVACASLAALVSFFLTPATIRLAHSIGAVDQPGERKVHKTPIPRLGGLAVVAAAILALFSAAAFDSLPARFMEWGEFWLAVGAGIVPILAISLRDDIRPVRVLPKFAAQLLGASTAVALGIRLNPAIQLFGDSYEIGWIAVPLSIMWICGVTNSFNIVDGLDGLSAGLALISAISLGAVAVVAKRPEMASASFIIAGALLGFLPYNLHPARVFLGDTGAASVGFTLACLALKGGSTMSAGMAILVPVLVLGLPIAETLVSMARRFLKRIERNTGGMFEADREHFHHKLLSLGLNHRQAVYVLYGAGLLCAVCAVGSMFLTYRRAAVLLVSLLIAAFVGLQKLGYHEFAFLRRGTMLKAYEVPVLRSTLFVVFIDVTMVVAALYAALVLKYDNWLVVGHRGIAQGLLPIVVLAFVVALSVFGVYRGSWRMATVDDLLKPVFASGTASVASYIIAAMMFEQSPSLSLHVIFAILAITLVAGSRLSYRLLAQLNQKAGMDGERVIIYGAGRGGTMVLREVLAKPELRVRPVGFVDDDPYLRGRFVNGLPVVGSMDTLASVLKEHSAAGVILSSNKVPAHMVAIISEICRDAGCWMRRFEVTFAVEEDVDRTAASRLPIGSTAALSNDRD